MYRRSLERENIGVLQRTRYEFSILLFFLSLGASISLILSLVSIVLQRYLKYGLFHIALGKVAENLHIFVLLALGIYFFLYLIPLAILRKGMIQAAYTALLSFLASLALGGAVLAWVNLAFFPAHLREIRRGDFFWTPFSPEKIRFLCINAALLCFAVLAGSFIRLLFFHIYSWKRDALKEKLHRLCSPILLLLFALPLLQIPAVALAKKWDTESPDHPNILLVVADTLRRDHMSCYGYPRKTTPNLDRFAESSILFEKAFSQAPLTVPSLASLLTGTYPTTHCALSNVGTLAEENLSLAEVLKDGGYQTAAFVSNGVLLNSRNLQQGFDLFDNRFTRYERNRSIPERIAQETTGKAVDWLRKAKSGPFFLFVHYQDPHGPYIPPPPFQNAFLEDGLDSPPERELSFAKKNDEPGGIPPYQRIRNQRSLRYYVSQYDGEILYMDHWIGKLIEALEDLHLEKNTLVVFTADHGESLGERNWYFQHGQSLSEELIRVPLIFRPLEGKPGKREEMVQLVDLFPTLVECTGLPQKAYPTEGRSFASLLSRGSGRAEPEWEEAILSEKPGEAWCLRTLEWKLILHPGIEKGDHLYRIATDPNQEKEVGGSHPKEMASLKKLFQKKIQGRHLHSKGQQADLLHPEEWSRLKILGYVE